MPDIDSALHVLRYAIQNEMAGQSFYLDAARQCVDPWTKEVFATLAQDEDGHAQLLLVEYESLATHGRWLDLETAWSRSPGVDITKFTFPDGGREEVKVPPLFPASPDMDRRATELEALSFGVRLEQSAIDLYRRQRQQLDDPAARQAYGFLVEEETRHYHQLQARWAAIAGRPFEGA